MNDELREEVIKVLMEANKAIMEIYLSSDLEISLKKDNSPLTKADLSAHRIISEGLRELTPNIPIVSEEEENSHFNDENLYWLLDPLDGTKEFIKKSGEFTSNIGLIKNSSPFYGFVSSPANETIYYGGKDLGSFKKGKNLEEKSIKCSTEKIPMRILMSKSHINKETLEFIKKLDKKYTTVQAGSSLKFLKIAEGKADLYPRLGPTSEWDTAAAHAVLEGAGGTVTQINGDPLVYNKKEILNPFFIAKGL